MYQTANPTWILCYLLLSLFLYGVNTAIPCCSKSLHLHLWKHPSQPRQFFKNSTQKNEAFHDYLTDDSGWWFKSFKHVKYAKIRTSQVKHLRILPGFGGFALWKVKNIEKCGVKSQTKKSSIQEEAKIPNILKPPIDSSSKTFLNDFQPAWMSESESCLGMAPKSGQNNKTSWKRNCFQAGKCKRTQKTSSVNHFSGTFHWTFLMFVMFGSLVKFSIKSESDAWFSDARSALSSEMFAWKQKTSLLVNWMKLRFTGLSIRVLFPIDQILEYDFWHVTYLSNHV